MIAPETMIPAAASASSPALGSKNETAGGELS